MASSFLNPLHDYCHVVKRVGHFTNQKNVDERFPGLEDELADYRHIIGLGRDVFFLQASDR